MLKTLNTRPYLTATTSVAALCIGLFVALPPLQQALQPLEKPKLTVEEIAPPTPPVATTSSDKDAKNELGRLDTTAQPEVTTLPAAPPSDQPAIAGNTAPLAERAPAQMTDTTAEPKSAAPLAKVTPDVLSAEQLTQLFDESTRTRGMASGAAAPTPGITAPHQLDNGQIIVLQNAPMVAPLDQIAPPPEPNTEAFATAAPNPVHVTAEEPVSTFSVDVDTASYAVIRSSLNAGQLPPPEAVRIEEMVNYFPYNYPAPEAGGAPFTDTVTVMPTPWNPNTRLVHIALQGRLPAMADRKPLNLVFLIDTSGSMEDANKLPLLKQSLTLMLSKLRPEDRIAIVAYAGSAGEVLPPTAASDRATILNALNNLAAGGSTAGAEGLTLAYQVADKMKRDGTISRVLLATDGDFNVGIDNPDDLKTFVAKERETGTYLSVLGFGRGNLDDATMQALAQNGNGTASYIDTLSEAQKVLVDQLTGALFPIADDVKIQVEWNPAQVAEYRLIGYETRALRREDFNNDKVDAGEIGAGLQVTA
ncbi:MAG: von Willebrand factor type A domain-containing protein, partial [bacterium]